MYLFHGVLTLFMVIFGHFNSLIDCSCMAPLTLAMIEMRGLTCHLANLNTCMSGL